MKDLEQAKLLLQEEGYTCVLVQGETVLTARHRGVKPLMQWLDAGQDTRGFSAADKVVGKAAAFLYLLMGVSRVYAGVISQTALEVLRQGNVEVTCGQCVEAIRNRTNTGFCPMEQAVMDCLSPEQAREKIRQTMQKLAAQEKNET